MGARAIFLDRDGVLIRDVHLLVRREDVEILPGVKRALMELKGAGYLLLVVSNQTVVSRGLATEQEVEELNRFINGLLGEILDAFYVCPHHPHADLPAYRTDCVCRKPEAGMLFKGAQDFDLELGECWMVGDRISDVIAGQRAGCRTVQVQTGAHLQKPIISASMPQATPVPDFVCQDLPEAARIILGEARAR